MKKQEPTEKKRVTGAKAASVSKKSPAALAAAKRVTGTDATSGKESPLPVITRSQADHYKQRAVKFEMNNHEFILVIPCNGDQGWYEMGEKSALFYKYVVCELLGVEVNLSDDFDSYYTQFDIGRIRTRGVDAIRKRLKDAKLYKDERLTDNCIIFQLTKRYSDKEIDELIDRETRRQASLNEIVKVKVVDAGMYNKMIDVSSRLHRICLRKMDQVSRETNGVRIVGMCDEMIMQYYAMAEIESTEPSYVAEEWKKIRVLAHKLLLELQIVSGLKLWKREACMKIGEIITEIEDRADTHIRKSLEMARQNNATSRSRSIKKRTV